MAKTLKAIYKDGVFKPLEPSDLKDNTEVQLIISEGNPFLQFAGVLSPSEAEDMMKVIEDEFERIEISEWRD